MARREAREESPTAEQVRVVEDTRVPGNGLQLLTDLRTAYLAGGRSESNEARERRMMAILDSRADEVTMTLLLMIEGSDDRIAYLINNALLGMRWNADDQRPVMGQAPPLHDRIELQSLRTKCQGCETGACGYVGKFHPIVYKSGQKGGTAQEHKIIVAMGGTVENNVLCDVDPETGRFSLSPLEAKKALRQWGEHAVPPTRRWRDRSTQKGDRWLIREVRHHELYANAVLTGALQKDVPAMTAL